MVLAARRIAVALSVLVAFAPFAIAHAQTDATTQSPPVKKPKKKPKRNPRPDQAASAAAADSAPTPPPPVDTTPPPAPPPPEPTPTASASVAAEAPEVSSNDPAEDPSRSYNFVGLRYRATILPAAMLHLFADGGKSIVTNTIGLELDHRRDGFSMIPWIVYTSYGTGDMLFLQKGQPEEPQYYSDINSGLKSIYAGVDLLWSVDLAKGLSFEYGAGFGLGFIFGNLGDNWVYASANGPLVGANGQHYTACQTSDTEQGCNKTDHTGPPSVAKVGGYIEKNWFGGGSVPVFFPHIAIPDIGLRYKPVKQVEMRINTGFSLTGFFFGISGDYGIPDKRDAKAEPASNEPSSPTPSSTSEDKPAPTPSSD